MSSRFEYTIKFDDNFQQNFTVDIDPESGLIRDNEQEAGPEWTRLEFSQCEHCPYSTQDRKYCPVAKNLSKASEAFSGERSYKKLMVFVKSENRIYGKQADLQTALFSLFGLIMATSSCSHMNRFKSMARFHLPFSNMEETSIRVLGSHLISEYLKQQKDPKYKISLDPVVEHYSKVAIVNKGIIERIRSRKEQGDANQNAILILDSFASLLPFEISSGLSEIRHLFESN